MTHGFLDGFQVIGGRGLARIEGSEGTHREIELQKRCEATRGSSIREHRCHRCVEARGGNCNWRDL